MGHILRKNLPLIVISNHPHTLSCPFSCIPSVPHHTPSSILPVSHPASHTMATCGIQSLTLLLCVVLILSTGAIIGGFTLTTWDDLLEKARDTGDEGFGMCLDSGTADIETVSSRYLRSVLGGVETAVVEYLKMPEQLVTTIAQLAQAHHPNVSTNPAFGDVMRPAVNAAFKAAVIANRAGVKGIDILVHETYPWCQAHQAVDEGDRAVCRMGE